MIPFCPVHGVSTYLGGGYECPVEGCRWVATPHECEWTKLTLQRADWRLLQHAVNHFGHYLVRRGQRPSSHASAVQRDLDRLRALSSELAGAAGTDEGEGFV